MSDQILFTGLVVESCHGVLASEKVERQPFIVDLVIDTDLRAAGESDDLTKTINYAEVAQGVEAILHRQPVDLIEFLADQIAGFVLEFERAEAVEVTIHKPKAPAGVPLTDNPLAGPAVRIRRERDIPVVIALGANLGDRAATLRAAVRELDRTDGVRVIAVAPLVETDPVGGPEQPDYFNTVLLARTRLAPSTLLQRLHTIECWHHRTRQVRWGARTLDLDLIQYGDPNEETDIVLDEPDLILPHPRAAQRAFVLQPWLAVDADAVLRVDGRIERVEDLLARCDAGGVRPVAETSPR